MAHVGYEAAGRKARIDKSIKKGKGPFKPKKKKARPKKKAKPKVPKKPSRSVKSLEDYKRISERHEVERKMKMRKR